MALIEDFLAKNPSEAQKDAFRCETFQALCVPRLCKTDLPLKDRVHLMREYGDTKTFLTTMILKSDEIWGLYSAYVDAVRHEYSVEPSEMEPMLDHYKSIIMMNPELIKAKLSQIHNAILLCTRRRDQRMFVD